MIRDRWSGDKIFKNWLGHPQSCTSLGIPANNIPLKSELAFPDRADVDSHAGYFCMMQRRKERAGWSWRKRWSRKWKWSPGRESLWIVSPSTLSFKEGSSSWVKSSLWGLKFARGEETANLGSSDLFHTDSEIGKNVPMKQIFVRLAVHVLASLFEAKVWWSSECCTARSPSIKILFFSFPDPLQKATHFHHGSRGRLWNHLAISVFTPQVPLVNQSTRLR